MEPGRFGAVASFNQLAQFWSRQSFNQLAQVGLAQLWSQVGSFNQLDAVWSQFCFSEQIRFSAKRKRSASLESYSGDASCAAGVGENHSRLFLVSLLVKTIVLLVVLDEGMIP